MDRCLCSYDEVLRRIVERFPVSEPMRKIEVMGVNMRNQEEQNDYVNWGFQPFNREQDIAICKHPVSKSFIKSPDTTTADNSKKHVFTGLLLKPKA